MPEGGISKSKKPGEIRCFCPLSLSPEIGLSGMKLFQWCEKFLFFVQYTHEILNFEKVCDSINRQIWKELHRANVPKGQVENVKNIYDKCENCVFLHGSRFERFQMFRDREVLYPLSCSTW
jgi:hypothetical protein